jgi:3-oxoacyl-ACP reductase-like protein
VKGFDPRQFYVGWVDAATGEAVADDEIKKRYEKTILEHSGMQKTLLLNPIYAYCNDLLQPQTGSGLTGRKETLKNDGVFVPAGIRVIEPELFEGYDPHHKTLYHQVAIDKKMAPLEVSSRQEAEDYRVELGEENVDIYQVSEGERHTFLLLLLFVLRFPSVGKRDHLPRQARDKRAQGTLTR